MALEQHDLNSKLKDKKEHKIMEKTIQKEYITFIEKQLSEMAKNVKKNSSKNQAKRENNIFLIFSDKNAKKYMGTGRSFDSQLGTRLQKIAMFAARRKYGVESVPNVITLQNKGEEVTISMISYPYSNGMSQKVYWTNSPAENLLNKATKNLFDKGSKSVEKTSYVLKSDMVTIKKIKDEFAKRDSKGNGIPIDLFVFEKTPEDKKIAYSYELKAGGNLDTKNAPSNANEVASLKTIFSFCDASISRFATCYDGKGDGTPDGSIGKNLKREEILIGEEFWKEILEENVSYSEFIELYKKACELAKVEEIVIG